MTNNSNSVGSQSSSESLPEFNQFVTWTLMRLPPEYPRSEDPRRVIMQVQANILDVIKETEILYERLRKPIQQNQAELKWSRDHSPWKGLADPDPKKPKDLSTALGYLSVKHPSVRYKTETALRAALTKYGIPIQSDTKVIADIRTGERINLGDTVLESDLDQLAQKIKAEKAVQKQTSRRRAEEP